MAEKRSELGIEKIKKRSEYERIAEGYKKEGRNAAAAEVHDVIVRYEESAKNFEKRGEYEIAAEIWERLGSYDKAARDYKIGGNPQGEKRARKASRGLDSQFEAIITIAGLGAGIFFLSSNITGNAIASLSTKTASFLGAILLIMGLVAGFFWFKSKRK